uniref:Putative secreted protein n=1 Tax=Ixodes scapularis TaxID=6945 RepID=A0A4D5RZ27_IXOSC
MIFFSFLLTIKKIAIAVFPNTYPLTKRVRSDFLDAQGWGDECCKAVLSLYGGTEVSFCCCNHIPVFTSSGSWCT